MIDFDEKELHEYGIRLASRTAALTLRGITTARELLVVGEFLDACDGGLIRPAPQLKRAARALALSQIVPLLDKDMAGTHKAISASFALVALHDRAMRMLDRDWNLAEDREVEPLRAITA